MSGSVSWWQKFKFFCPSHIVEDGGEVRYRVLMSEVMNPGILVVGGSCSGPTEMMVEEMTEKDVFGGVQRSSGFGDVFECQSEVFWVMRKMCLVHVDRLVDVPGTARIEDLGAWNHREFF